MHCGLCTCLYTYRNEFISYTLPFKPDKSKIGRPGSSSVNTISLGLEGSDSPALFTAIIRNSNCSFSGKPSTVYRTSYACQYVRSYLLIFLQKITFTSFPLFARFQSAWSGFLNSTIYPSMGAPPSINGRIQLSPTEFLVTFPILGLSGRPIFCEL